MSHVRDVRAGTEPARRMALPLQGVVPALLAGVLALVAANGLAPLTFAVLALQLLIVFGVLAVLDAPASGGAFLVAAAAAVGADVVVLATGEAAGVAGVVGVTVLAVQLHQLSRRRRSRVIESMADTLVAAVAAVSTACLLVLEQLDGGQALLLLTVTVTGAALFGGRLGDLVLSRPAVAAGASRGWPGLVLSLLAGTGTALVVARPTGSTSTIVLTEAPLMLELPIVSAALIGVLVAATAVTADLVVDLAAAELRSGWRDSRRVAALRPTALLVPFALVGPVALLAARLVLP